MLMGMTNVGGLQRIIIRGLFGFRNHDISLDANRPSVLTGANGTGKSTILRLVNAVSTSDMAALQAAPVRILQLQFSNLPKFTLMKTNPDIGARIRWGDHTIDVSPVNGLPGTLPEWAADYLRGGFTGSDVDEWEVALSSAARAAGATFDEFTTVRDMLKNPDEPALEAPQWMKDLADQFPVLFITDQRLVVEPARTVRTRRTIGPKSPRLAVEAASADIASQMRQVDSAYARSSQQQDRRFPRDVIQAMSRHEAVPLAELEKLLTVVDSSRERLRDVGLLDSDQGYEPELAPGSLEQENVRPVIATFLRSTMRKLEVLEALSARLRIFQSFLNQRFGATKQLSLSRHGGVQFRLRNGTNIRPSQLSSGEQQMMILAYEILFRSSEGTLVVIDEPEISLHVLWQDTLIDNLVEMGKASAKQFLLATHSPALLAGHPELERSLDEDIDSQGLLSVIEEMESGAASGQSYGMDD